MIELLKSMMSSHDPDHLFKSVSDSFQNLPIHLHCKDRKGRYIDFNEQVVIDAGFTKSTDFRGLTDLDFTFLKEGEALNIRNRDSEVIAKGAYNINMGSLSLHDNIIAQEISIKNPIKSKFEKKIIGVVSLAFVLRENSPSCEEFFRKNAKMSLNPINDDLNTIYQKLTNREKQCLKLYLSGETGRSTAVILGLSHRTVDEYINNIKYKFKCNRKRDLLKLFNPG